MCKDGMVKRFRIQVSAGDRGANGVLIVEKKSMLQGIAILGQQCVISVENGGTVLVKAPYSGRSIGCLATKWVEEE